MDIDRLDIDWDFVIERLDRILDLGEEYLTRRLSEYELDPEIFRHFIAFRWLQQKDGSYLEEVAYPDLPDYADLFGIAEILQRLERNTKQFIHSYPANNVLLWGEPGTGKSSAVKGLLKPFAPQGLRLVEIDKNALLQLPQIVSLLREKPYRFILFCDDLSFNEAEPGYRELNALLEGGIEEPATNILIYATSNCHHLLPGPTSDNDSEQKAHPGPFPADRFGLSLGFYPMSQPTYLEIVVHLARQRRLIITDIDLHSAALRWAREKGSHSGRVARQFIDDLSGQMAMAGKIAPLSS